MFQPTFPWQYLLTLCVSGVALVILRRRNPPGNGAPPPWMLLLGFIFFASLTGIAVWATWFFLR
jgi:hypothetical protein